MAFLIQGQRFAIILIIIGVDMGTTVAYNKF